MRSLNQHLEERKHMRVNRRSLPRVPNNTEILIKGFDMFGTPFVEEAATLNFSQDGLCFSLLRPISSGGEVEFRFRCSDSLAGSWTTGRIIWVSERFDGYQSVGVSVKGMPDHIESGLRADRFRRSNVPR